MKFLTSVGLYGKEIRDEAEVYGQDHWSHPARFSEVKQALIDKPVAYLAGDVTDPEFTAEFLGLLDRYHHKISFANLTNIAIYNSDLSFIEQWPLDNTPVIMYSKYEAVTSGNPPMHLAYSAAEYRQSVGR
jgi:hypothetical protein